VRVGFEILDLATSKCGWLAHVNQKSGPQIGKYRVNIEDLQNTGVKALIEAVKRCDVIAIDEIGPMELTSQRFKEAVRKALESSKLVLAVIHWKAKDTLLSEVKNRDDAKITNVTLYNREKLPKSIVEEAIKILNMQSTTG
jgi:nucleoside-triphosphatase